MIEFNVNGYVRVRLTDKGRQILRQQHEETKAQWPGLGDYSPPVEDIEGWSRWQAWQLINQLGAYLSMGLDPPFDTTIIIEN